MILMISGNFRVLKLYNDGPEICSSNPPYSVQETAPQQVTKVRHQSICIFSVLFFFSLNFWLNRTLLLFPLFFLIPGCLPLKYTQSLCLSAPILSFEKIK